MTHEILSAIRDWLVALIGGLVLLAVSRHLRAKDARAKEFDDLKELVRDLRAKVSEVCRWAGIPWP